MILSGRLWLTMPMLRFRLAILVRVFLFYSRISSVLLVKPPILFHSFSLWIVALFACSLPIAATAAFVANWIEVKTDAYKLMYIFQKPVPRGAEDIGLWYWFVWTWYVFVVLRSIDFVLICSCPKLYFSTFVISGKIFSPLLQPFRALPTRLWQFSPWMSSMTSLTCFACGSSFCFSGDASPFR